MTAVFSAILEIEATQTNRRDAGRYERTLERIRHSTIEGHNVVGVIVDANEERCRIAHFRYNYLCKDGCDHKSMQYGVLRYFGLSIVLDGDADIVDIADIYKPNQYSELELCSKTLPYTGKRYAMPKAT